MRRIGFAVMAVGLSVSASIAAIVIVDLYLHHWAEEFWAVNAWGYRGAVVARKRPGEHRLVVLGGSTVFGWGVTVDRAFPAQLETQLRPLSRNGAPVTVVNLGINSQGAYAFMGDLEDYRYLDYDSVVLYEGYNDLSDSRNLQFARRDSPVFSLTGYYAIFPKVFRDKAMALRYGNSSAADGNEKTVFKAGVADRVTAAALEATVQMSSSLERQLGRLNRASGTTLDNRQLAVDSRGCPSRWDYCAAQYNAIQYALGQGKKVLVVTQPYLGSLHEEQQAALRTMLAHEFRGVAGLRYVNLGPLFDPLTNPHGLFFDGMHATAEGNRQIGSHLAGPVTELMSDAFDPAVRDGPASSR